MSGIIFPEAAALTALNAHGLTLTRSSDGSTLTVAGTVADLKAHQKLDDILVTLPGATEADNVIATISLNLRGKNDAPVLKAGKESVKEFTASIAGANNEPPAELPAETSFTLSDYFEDPEGADLTYTLSASSLFGLSFTLDNGVITLGGTPTTEDDGTLIVTASDGDKTALLTLSLTVGPPASLDPVAAEKKFPAKEKEALSLAPIGLGTFFDGEKPGTTYKLATDSDGDGVVTLSGVTATLDASAKTISFTGTPTLRPEDSGDVPLLFTVVATNPDGREAQKNSHPQCGGDQ